MLKKILFTLGILFFLFLIKTVPTDAAPSCSTTNIADPQYYYRCSTNILGVKYCDLYNTVNNTAVCTQAGGCTYYVSKPDGSCTVNAGKTACTIVQPGTTSNTQESCCTSNCGGNPTNTPVPPTPTPYHLGCSGKNCVRVAGTGNNDCGALQSDAPACTHRACNNGQCILVAGGGQTNNCNADCDCPGATGCATHKTCNNGQCIVVSGAGTDNCSVNCDCPGATGCGGCRAAGGQCGALNSCCSGLNCVNNVCVTPPGGGCSAGQTDPHNTCSGSSCVSTAGCGTNSCSATNPCPTAPPPLEWHLVCLSCSCTRRIVPGGTDQCTTYGEACTPPISSIPSDQNSPARSGLYTFSINITASPKTGSSGFQPTATVNITADTFPSFPSNRPSYSCAIYWTATRTQSVSCLGGSATAPAGLYTAAGTSYPITVVATRTQLGFLPQTASHTTYVLTDCGAVSTVTPGDTATPTPPVSWIKLVDTSFTGVSNLYNPIPTLVKKFNGDDPGNAVFIDHSNLSDPGEAVGPSINTGSSDVSSKKWKTNDVTFNPQIGVSSFISYLKSRKTYTPIPITQDLKSGITADKTIYLVEGDRTISDDGTINKDNIVLVINGNLTITKNKFNPSKKTTAILVNGDLILDPAVSELDGIFVVEGRVNAGGGTTGLEVVGNLITQKGFTSQRSQTDNSYPSVLIKFDPSYYGSLLPYLSIRDYDWTQLTNK